MIYTESECIKRYKEDIKNPLINTWLKDTEPGYFLDTPIKWVYNPEYINYFSCKVLNPNDPAGFRDLTEHNCNTLYSLYDWSKLFKLLYGEQYVGGLHFPVLNEFTQYYISMNAFDEVTSILNSSPIIYKQIKNVFYVGSFRSHWTQYTYEQLELICNNVYSIDGAALELSNSPEELQNLINEIPFKKERCLDTLKTKLGLQ
jgi:hypothetical protein